MSEPDSVTRKPGRPKDVQEGTSVSAWIPATSYDRLAHLALERDTTVSKIVRDLIVRRLP